MTSKLYQACRDNNTDEVIKLLNHKDQESLNFSEDNYTPLIWACYYGNIEIVKLLLNYKEIKQSLNKAKYNGETPLFWACWSNSTTIVKLLLNLKEEIKQSLNKVNSCGNTPLHWICYHNNIEIVKLLLDHDIKKSIKLLQGKERKKINQIIKSEIGKLFLLNMY